MAKKKITPDSDALSQNDIDALLGNDDDGGGEMNQSAIDALLGIAPGEEDTSDQSAPPPGAQMDQSLIDALLGGGLNADAEDSATTPPAPVETSDDLGAELDQSAIDALLGSHDPETPAKKTTPEQKTTAPPTGELDQSLIDALLGGGLDADAEDSATTSPAPAEAEDALGAELDQSAIDALLGNHDTETPAKKTTPEQKTTAPPTGELDQSLIDALLGGGLDAEAEDSAAISPAPAETDDAFGAELDQSAIDALMGGGLEAENIPVTPAASAATIPAEASGELEQSDIDALLGSAMAPKTKGEKKPAPTKSRDMLGEELDQSDINALLGGGDTDRTRIPAQTDDFGELDQATIDALMGGGDTGEIKPARTAAPDEDFGELDQETIDAMMAGGGEETSVSPAPPRSAVKKGMEGKPGTPDQDEIDQLFSGGEESPDYTLDAFASEGEDEVFKEIFDKTGDSDASVVAGRTDTDTGDESLGFEEELFASDEKTIAESATLSAEKDIFAGVEARPTAPVTPAKAGKTGKKSFLPFMHAPGGKIAKAAAAIGLAGILGVTVYFYLTGHQGVKTTAVPQPPPVSEQHPQPPAAVVAPEAPAPPPPVVTPNHPPQIADGRYYLPEANAPLALQLAGQDDDNDTLQFEIITAPKHGELSGRPPQVTYTPGKDFPGEDLFEYRASDGRDFSNPAKVTIARCEPVVTTAPPPPKPPPAKKVARAEDVTLHTTSTEELDIDWQAIWERFNRIPFSRAVQVEVIKNTRHGQLQRLSAARHQYQPEPYFSGQDELEYRFRLGEAVSRKKKLRLQVGMGNPRPEIKLAAVSPSYKVGATVLLDASQTRDNERESLTFSWELISGVPVQMAFKNREGSKAAFVMPSTFRAMPGLVIRVTAMDRQGQSDSRDIRIATIQPPAQETALWQGQVDGSIGAGPDCGPGRCLDGLRYYGD